MPRNSSGNLSATNVATIATPSPATVPMVTFFYIIILVRHDDGGQVVGGEVGVQGAGLGILELLKVPLQLG